MPEPFGGDKKVGRSVLWLAEQRLIRWAAPRVPAWIRSNHLTLATIPISFAIVLCGYAAQTQDAWLYVGAVFIFLQWVTDSLDGAVGRLRNEGFIRWGYYMDHFLDYVFLVSVLVSYMLLLPTDFILIHFFVLAIFAGYMVHAFLAFGATNQFRIAHLGVGPTEIRLLFIAINILLALFGKTHLRWALPYALGLATIGLVVVVYRAQKELAEYDLRQKKETGASL
jgi:phosphatidylglycerophosphate synthase